MCAGLGLRICEGKGGRGTLLGPPSLALSLPEPAALPSVASLQPHHKVLPLLTGPKSVGDRGPREGVPWWDGNKLQGDGDW